MVSLETSKQYAVKLKNWFFSVIYTPIYPVLLSLIALFFWTCNFALGGLILYVICACVILATIRDFTPIIPPLFLVSACFRELSELGSVATLIVLVPVAVCLIVHLIRFPFEKNQLGALLPWFTLVAVAFLLGGLLSKYTSDYFNGMNYIIPVGLVLPIIYFLFSKYFNPPKNLDVLYYIGFTIICLAFIGIFQIVIVSAYQKLFSPIFIADNEIGWANYNTIASIILLAIPLSAYCICKSNKVVLPLIIFVALYTGLFITLSSACFFISVIFLPILLFFIFRHLKNKYKQYLIYFLIIACLAFTVFFIIFNQTITWLFSSNELNNYMSSTGRDKLFDEAIKIFKENPFFGAGLGYTNDSIYNMNLGQASLRGFNFHSTLMQVLATMGIFGLVAYIFYFTARIKILIKHNTLNNIFAFLSFVMFECYAMVDTGEFNLMPLMILVSLLLLSVEHTNKQKTDDLMPSVHEPISIG